MTTTEHGPIVKPEKLVETAVGFLEDELLLPQLFQKETFDKYKGTQNDEVNFKVEGILPFHEYALRNDRSNPLELDEYAERSYSVKLGSRFYSAVEATDEQLFFDLGDWGKLLKPQTKAVARGLNRQASSTIQNAAYNVVLGDCAADIDGSLIEARRILNALHAPDGDRFMVVGSDFESLLLSDNRITLSQNVGDSIAGAVVQEATLGKLRGFRFVVDQTIKSDEAYAFAGSAFVWANAAPAVPSSIKLGATTAFEGVALRWMRDYDSMFLRERNIMDSWSGFRQIEDVLVGWDSVNNREYVTTDEYLVRAIKLKLDGASVRPAANSDLGKAAPGAARIGAHLKGAAKTAADD